MMYYFNWLTDSIIGLDFLAFTALLLIDIVLIAYVLYLTIRSSPFGTVPKIFNLVFTFSFFITFWLVAYVLIHSLHYVISVWLSKNYNLYGQLSFILIVVAPTVIYLYLLYVSYLKNTYLSVDDLKRRHPSRQQ